jgi:hypothetical protein
MDTQTDLKQLDLIKKNTKLVIEKLGPLSGIDFGLNRESVEWIEGFIERQRAREDFDLEESAGLVDVIGSFLGEAIIANGGGEWRGSETHGLGIAFPDGNFCYPFNKVNKAFREGLDGGDSILSFYDFTVNLIAKGRFWEETSSAD